MTVANNSAMPVASPAQGDVAMTEAAPVSEIVKDVAAVLHEGVGYGNGNAAPHSDGQVQPSVEEVIVEDLIVEEVIGMDVYFLVDNYVGSSLSQGCEGDCIERINCVCKFRTSIKLHAFMSEVVKVIESTKISMLINIMLKYRNLLERHLQS